MKNNKFKIEEISIGDQIYFEEIYIGNTLSQSNYDEYWDVHGISENRILINLRREHYWSVNIEEVRQLIKITKEK